MVGMKGIHIKIFLFIFVFLSKMEENKSQFLPKENISCKGGHYRDGTLCLPCKEGFYAPPTCEITLVYLAKLEHIALWELHVV